VKSKLGRHDSEAERDHDGGGERGRHAPPQEPGGNADAIGLLTTVVLSHLLDLLHESVARVIRQTFRSLRTTPTGLSPIEFAATRYASRKLGLEIVVIVSWWPS
jgi:hypothetical protein